MLFNGSLMKYERALHNLTFVFDYIRHTSSLRSFRLLKERSGAKSNYIWYFKGLFDMFIWQIHKNKMQTNAQRVTAMGAKRTEGLDFIPGEISAISGSTPSKTAYFCHHSLEKRCFVRFDFINLQFRQAPKEGERFWLLHSV